MVSNALKLIDEKKELLIKELKKISGLKSGIDEVISEIFTKEKNKFLIALGRLEKEIIEEEKSSLSSISYAQIFNKKVIDFLNTKDFKNKLSEYTQVYDNLISNSNFFKKGIFNHYQASEIAKQLKNHGFFKAEHSVYLSNKKEIKTEKELEDVIQQEKQAILTNPDLSKVFEEIDSELKKNEELREFREYLLNNQNVINELSNPDLLKEKLWKAYLIENKELFLVLMEEYNKGKKRIQEITEEASNQATEWQKVINIFNRRFSVPFKVSIENKEDVILKRVTPNIKFQFFDEENNHIPIEKSELTEVLSNGEGRALYILNIIFEVEARRTSNLKTLFVIDDIADSFDYKNKYAIVEYLNDILIQENFYQLILTHNYDFYRTVSGRLEIKEKRYITVKTDNSIILESDKNYRDIFKKWKNNAENPDKSDMLIALIPFARNLSEYCGYESEEQKLTSLLHMKQDTNSITVADLEKILKVVLQDKKEISLPNPNSLVKELIYQEAKNICDNTEITVELEQKIVLSIAIRLRTEEFLIKKINKPEITGSIKSNQTVKLIQEYKRAFENLIEEKESIKTVERVNLMTPENIHLNSFMYEPLLDMSNEHLKKLYSEVLLLN